MTARPGGLDELSRTLADLRAAAGLSGAEAGRLAGFSQAKISRIEHGRNVPSLDDVSLLTQVYKAKPAVRKRLLELAKDVREENQRVVLVKRAPAGFQERIRRIEEASEHVATFTPTVVPGLLQTEMYMRTLAAPAGLDPAELDEFVAARRRRQELLGDPSHRFTLITTEGALGWRAGTPAEMTAQVEHLAAVSRQPNVEVGIIPWGARMGVFPLHGWDLYDQRAVIVGTMNATAVLTARSDVDIYVQLFDELAKAALVDDDARALLADIATRYRQQDATVPRRPRRPRN